MPVIIKNGLFCEDSFLANSGGFVQLDQLSLLPHDLDKASTGIDVPNDSRPDALRGLIGHVSAVRIPFPSFADGRGFSLAQRLRRDGFSGLLRAQGHITADQYPLAIRSGFDEIEISNEQAGRMPQAQWKESFLRTQNNYLDRLKQRSNSEAA